MGQAINAVTGTRASWLLTFLSQEDFCFRLRSAVRWAGGCAAVRILLRSPTGDAATSASFLAVSPRWHASCRSFLPAAASFSPQRRRFTVGTERSQTVMRSLHQQRAQIRIAFLARCASAARSAPSSGVLAAVRGSSPHRDSCGSDADLPVSAEESDARSVCPRP